MRTRLFTGARVGEILSLRWSAVDLVSGALHLADSKTGAKTIVLNGPAVEVLRACPRFAGSPYVFPGEGRGKRKGQHRVSLADPWAWITKRARLREVRVHDLRHSFASVADYTFWLRADYFAEHLLGAGRRGVDVVEMNREKQQVGNKR